jgi:hypothetical protein
VTVEVLDPAGQAVARASRRVGFRTIAARGSEILLNDRGLQVRGALTWGWNPTTLNPDLNRADSLELIDQVRRFGFNLFKACLYVPSDAFLDAADELGMLVWLELPLWQPSMTAGLRELVFAEYEAILRRIAHHPSIGVLSLGCELDAQVDAGMLGQLRALARHWCPSVLLCGNSGSADAYGGADSGTFADDFYDYHFYCEPTELDGLMDHFNRAYRPVKPWLFGECLDAENHRRLPRSAGRRGHSGWRRGAEHDRAAAEPAPAQAHPGDHSRASGIGRVCAHRLAGHAYLDLRGGRR